MTTIVLPSNLFAFDADDRTMRADASTLERYMWARKPSWFGYLSHKMPDGSYKNGMYIKSVKTDRVVFFELSSYVYVHGEDKYDKIRNDLGACVASIFKSDEVENFTVIVDNDDYQEAA